MTDFDSTDDIDFNAEPDADGDDVLDDDDDDDDDGDLDAEMDLDTDEVRGPEPQSGVDGDAGGEEGAAADTPVVAGSDAPEEVQPTLVVPAGEEPEGGITNRKLMIWGATLGVAYLVISVLDVVWASYRVTEVSAPAAVVLGAAQYNGEPSEALRRRLDRAAELYIDGRVELVVVTGGGQEADITTEAKSGYDYLRETAAIPDENLRLEVQGSSTYESLAAVERFLEPENISDVILVTDRYHARRSQLIASEVGLNASVYPTEGSLPVERVASESAAVAAGRVIGFRRLNNYVVG